MHILVVEDDPKICQELSRLLEDHGYQVSDIHDFHCVLEESQKLHPDLILLDVNLPYEDGYELCQKLKKERQIPIIFVTSRNTDEDELKSIVSGGNDFIKKPYNKTILLEKIKRVFDMLNPTHYKELTVRDITLDLHLSILKYQGQEIELTRNEFRILYYFFLHPGRIIPASELIEYLWNDKYYLDENILIVNINRLRKKALEIGLENMIKTVRGEGYSL